VWRLTLLNWSCDIQMLYTKTANINVLKLTSLNLMFRTTIMTHVKPQIKKFQAEKSCQVGFKLLRRLYSWKFVRWVKSFVHVSVSYASNIFRSKLPQGLFGLNLKDVPFVLNVDNTSTIHKLQVVICQFPDLLIWLFPTSLKVMKTVQSITFYLQVMRLKDMHSN
jgi:hypothetical protein